MESGVVTFPTPTGDSLTDRLVEGAKETVTSWEYELAGDAESYLRTLSQQAADRLREDGQADSRTGSAIRDQGFVPWPVPVLLAPDER